MLLLILLQSNRPGSPIGIYILLFLVASLYVFVVRPLLQRESNGGWVNSVEDARRYAEDYHARRSSPFTRSEEHRLINTIQRRFGLSEETAASVVADAWPQHRNWQPHR